MLLSKRDYHSETGRAEVSGVRQNQRGVILFMAVGLAVALMVGIAVWNASSPEHTATAGYTAPDTSATPVAAAPSRTTTTVTSGSKRSAAPASAASTPARGDRGRSYQGGGEDDISPSTGPANPNYRVEADPLAPPHAVMAAPKPSANPAPGTVYRPTNVLPATGADSAADPERAEGVTSAPSSPSAPSAPSTPGGTAGPTAGDAEPTSKPTSKPGAEAPATSEQSPAEPSEPTPTASHADGPEPETNAPEVESGVISAGTAPAVP